MHSKLLGSLAVLVALAGPPACGPCSPDPSARGSASIAWAITMLGQPATCARAGAASVSLTLHSRASGADTTAVFPCTDTPGVTAPVPAGAYDATLGLHAADGATLAKGTPQTAVSIAAGHVAALTPVTFAVPDRGKLELSIATLSTTTNCLPIDAGGAGITGTMITLKRPNGGCAPVTLVRSRGPITLGTYAIDCGAPAVASCIERDESLTVDGVASGPYAIGVSALSGSRRGLAGEDVFVVPAGGSLVKPIQLAPSVLNPIEPTPDAGAGG